MASSAYRTTQNQTHTTRLWPKSPQIGQPRVKDGLKKAPFVPAPCFTLHSTDWGDYNTHMPTHSPETALFTQKVASHMDAPPPQLFQDLSCRDVVRILRDAKAARALVVDSRGTAVGIITDHDITHKVVYRVPPTTCIREVMQRPVITVRPDDYLFQAVALMRDTGHEHLPVLRGSDVCGVLHLNDALAASTPRAMNMVNQFSAGSEAGRLKSMKRLQVSIVAGLLEDEVPVSDILAVVTQINREIHRTILQQAIQDLQTEGWGAVPVDFEVLVMGSGGRGESLLYPDQDNGFIWREHTDAQRYAIDSYFSELAVHMTRELNRAGFPPCRGHVMASNPLWRKSLSEWRAQLRYWMAKPNPQTLRLCDIFFDFCPVYGGEALSGALREMIAIEVPRHHHFLLALYRVQSEHGLAVSPFGRLTTDSDHRHHRELNLKYHALVPLVETVRLLALKTGVTEASTLARIGRLNEKQMLDGDESDYLAAAFQHLSGLLLRQQVNDFGVRPLDGYVPLSSLSRRERDLTLDYLRAVNRLRARSKSLFVAELAPG